LEDTQSILTEFFSVMRTPLMVHFEDAVWYLIFFIIHLLLCRRDRSNLPAIRASSFGGGGRDSRLFVGGLALPMLSGATVVFSKDGAASTSEISLRAIGKGASCAGTVQLRAACPSAAFWSSAIGMETSCGVSVEAPAFENDAAP